MTIENQQRRIVYDADGVSLAYPVPFLFLEPEWLTVSVGTGEIGTTDTTLVDGVDYEVTGAGDPAGGVVILATPQPDGMKLAISRWVPLTQQEVYPEGGKFPAETTEDCFDKLTMIAQQLKDMATSNNFSPSTSTETGAHVAAWISENVTAAENAASAAATSEANAAASAAAAAQSEVRAEQAIIEAESAISVAEAAAASAAADAATAVDAANGALNSESWAYQWAQNPEDDPVRENPDTGEEEFSAYHWAKKAQDVTGVYLATETVTGIARFGTAAEHAAGLNGVAAQPGRVRAMLFENGGAGPKLRGDILPAASDAALGAVQPDGETITVDAAGVISAAGGGGGGVPSGVICMWSGAVDAVPDAWALCDGTNGTPDLRDRFVVGAGAAYGPGDKGGAAKLNCPVTVDSTTLTINQMPAHNHNLYERNDSAAGSTNSVSSSQYAAPAWNGRWMQNTGGGLGHGHAAAVVDAKNLPPYYALAYIIKL